MLSTPEAKTEMNTPKVSLPCNYRSLFLTFFKIGAFTFGGGFAMIPLIKDEIVDRHCWLDQKECLDIIGITQISPGAVAINTAIFVGYKLFGLLGAFIAAVGIITPSFFIILIIASLFSQYQSNPIVQSFFTGVRPGVVALILAAAIKMGKGVLVSGFGYLMVALGLICVIVLGMHPIIAILLAGTIGYLTGLVVGKEG